MNQDLVRNRIGYTHYRGKTYLKSMRYNNMSEKIVGMFGGKFLPLHRGHYWTIWKMSLQCDVAYLCLFINSPEEKRSEYRWYLDPDFRYYQLRRAINKTYLDHTTWIRKTEYRILVIDCSEYMTDGKEDWVKEAEYIKGVAGHIDRVYSSERSYDDIFKKVYPDAEHVLVDPDRKVYNISATELREKDDIEELVKWMV